MRKTAVVESANLHLVTLQEINLLAELHGKLLHEIEYDAISILCSLGNLDLLCSPNFGTGRSLSDSHEELIRLSFGRIEKNAVEDWKNGGRSERRHIGKTIERVRVLTSLVMFTPPVDVGPTDMLGVELPAGREYGSYKLRPFSPEAEIAVRRFSNDKLVNQVDIGIQLEFEDGETTAIVTNGYAIFPHIYWTKDEVSELLKTSLPVPITGLRE